MVVKKRIIIMLVLMGIIMASQSCTRKWEEESTSYYWPSWTPDSKIVYFEDWHKAWIRQNILGGTEIYKHHFKLSLKEMDENGSEDRVIYELYDGINPIYSPFGGNISVGSDRIVFAYQPASGSYDKPDTMIFMINRDGTGLFELCMGKYPNFFAGEDSIIYERSGEGISIMDTIGIVGQIQAIDDNNAKQPDVDRNNEWIVFCKIKSLGTDSIFVQNRIDSSLIPLFASDRLGWPNFATLSDSVIFGFQQGIRIESNDGSGGRSLIVQDFGWVELSFDCTKFVGSNREGIFVMNIDGSNKHRIK